MTESAYEAAQRTIDDMPNMDDAHLADVRRNAHKQMLGWRRLHRRRKDNESWQLLESWCDVEAAAAGEQCARMMTPRVQAAQAKGESDV
jgi:hypothetical protein